MQFYNNNPMVPQQAWGGNPQMTPIPNSFGGQPQMMPSQPQQDTVIDWVMGRSGAEAYMLKPNTNGFLMDSNNNGETVYTKSTDMSGRYSPLRSFKMVPFEDQGQSGMSEPIDYEKIRSIISDEVSKQMDARSMPNNKKENK